MPLLILQKIVWEQKSVQIEDFSIDGNIGDVVVTAKNLDIKDFNKVVQIDSLKVRDILIKFDFHSVFLNKVKVHKVHIDGIDVHSNILLSGQEKSVSDYKKPQEEESTDVEKDKKPVTALIQDLAIRDINIHVKQLSKPYKMNDIVLKNFDTANAKGVIKKIYAKEIDNMLAKIIKKSIKNLIKQEVIGGDSIKGFFKGIGGEVIKGIKKAGETLDQINYHVNEINESFEEYEKSKLENKRQRKQLKEYTDNLKNSLKV